MSKLFKLKEWLTIKETAQHLSGVLGEPVEEKDIYRLALDGHLRLSVDFVNHAYAQLGKIVGKEDIEYFEAPDDIVESLSKSIEIELEKPLMLPKSLMIDDENYMNFDRKVFTIRGVWDLLMSGNEAIDIEHYYQQSIGGVEVTLTNLNGAYVRRGNKVAQIMEDFEKNEYQSGSKAQLRIIEAKITNNNLNQKEANAIREKFKIKREEYLKKRASSKREDNYYPAGGLPSDSILVVKTEAIFDFLNSFGGEKPVEKSLTSKERNTLLVVIGALCNDANIDYNQRGIAVSIEKMTEILGAPVTDDTIRNILKQIDDAVSLRSK